MVKCQIEVFSFLPVLLSPFPSLSISTSNDKLILLRVYFLKGGETKNWKHGYRRWSGSSLSLMFFCYRAISKSFNFYSFIFNFQKNNGYIKRILRGIHQKLYGKHLSLRYSKSIIHFFFQFTPSPILVHAFITSTIIHSFALHDRIIPLLCHPELGRLRFSS